MTTKQRRLPAPISWNSAVLRQFRWIALVRRRQLLVLLAVGLVIAVLPALPVRLPAVWSKTGADGTEVLQAGWWTVEELPIFAYPDVWTLFLVYQVLLFLGLLWPISIWRGESPAERDLFRSLPVAGPGHELARVAAGVGWLVVVVIGLLALTVLGIVVAGNGSQLWVLAARSWIHYLTGPLTLYLLASVAGLWSQRPGRSILATFVVLFGSFSLSATLDLTFIESICRFFIAGPLSYSAAMIGPVEDLLLSAPTQVLANAATSLWLGVAMVAVVVTARWRSKA